MAISLVADLADELAAADLHLAAGAEEVDAEAVLVLDRDAAGVDELDAPLGVRLLRRANFDRPAGVDAQAPLGDVEVVGAQSVTAAAAELAIAPPRREV